MIFWDTILRTMEWRFYKRVLKTSVDVALDQGRNIGEGSVGVAMIADDSATRICSFGF